MARVLLERIIQAIAVIAANVRIGSAFIKAFYATLSPDQQRTFDRDTPPPGPNR